MPREPLNPLVLYGAGGVAREILWLLEQQLGDARWEPVCLIDDDPRRHGQRVEDVEVVSLDEAARRHPGAPAIAAVGAPPHRETLVASLAAKGFAFATLFHRQVFWSRTNRIGEGSVVQAGTLATTGIEIGRHVLLNGAQTLGHDVCVGDFSTIGPGCNVSGWVHIGRHVSVGAGAVILEGTPSAPLVVGEGAVIGAGACVTRSVRPWVTVVGVPAREVVGRTP